MDEEIWCKVKEINYDVSSHGRVKNLKTGHISLGGNIKKYKALRVKGHPVFYIHRLVGKYFVPNPENKPEINHVRGNTHNNHYKNLEWATRLENVEHAHSVLNISQYRKNRFSFKEEIEIVKLNQVYNVGYKTIGKIYGRNWNSIRAVVKRFKGKPELYATL